MRAQLADRLPPYMVPAAVVVLPELPLTVNGKLDVRALPAAEYTAGEYRAAENATQEILAGIYAETLGLDRVGIDSSFFDLGGDSISAMRLISAINASVGTDLPVRLLFEAPTVRRLSERLATDTTAGQDVVPVQTLQDGSGVPLFCIHAVTGVSWPYQVLGNYLDCPIIGIQQIERDEDAMPESIRDMAESYADRIQEAHPAGPYHLIGWSFGGVVAHEVAIELQRRGCVVARLILLDAQPAIDERMTSGNHEFDEQQVLEQVLRTYNVGVPAPGEPLSYDRMAALLRESGVAEISQYKQLFDLLVGNLKDNVARYRIHEPRLFDGEITLFPAVRDQSERGSSLVQSWAPYASGEILTYPVDCTHDEMLTAGSVPMYGQQLRELVRAEPPS
jgi:thioesterase domain-containing protein/acyl carrier protein